MKKKIKLDTLNVNSFITGTQKQINGGGFISSIDNACPFTNTTCPSNSNC